MKIEKVEKLVANLHDKTEYVTHMINLKNTLNHRVVLKKVHRVIKFNQNAGLKMKTDLRKKVRHDLENIFLGWWIMQLLEKLWKMWEKIKILNLLQQKEERIA